MGREGAIAILNVLEHVPSLPIKHLDITVSSNVKSFVFLSFYKKVIQFVSAFRKTSQKTL